MIHDDILGFLRDAQFRIAELTYQINDLLIEGEIESPKDKNKIRIELMEFVEVLYEINWNTFTGYNLLVTTDTVPIYYNGWTQDNITKEMQYLRSKSGMVDLPLLSFGPYWTEVVNIVTGLSQGVGIDLTGDFGQFLMFSISGQPVAVDIDPYAGMLPNETIANYFLGRP